LSAECLPSRSFVSLPGKQSVGCGHSQDDQHPVLDIEAKEADVLHKKLHDASLSFSFGWIISLSEAEIYYSDTPGVAQASADGLYFMQMPFQH
jgi:hypothetical protein